MNTILITGTNRGIGLELVNQYADNNWRVFACCRSPENAPALQKLADENSNISVHALDVSDSQQITALASELKNTPIDILFNNAGIYGPYDANFGNTNEQEWLACFRINTLSPMKMSEAFVKHVASSQLKTIATMSSKMGSMSDNGSGGSYLYRSSKAAVNAVMTSMAIDLKPQGIKVAILHPGWVKTDMGGPNGEINTVKCVLQLQKTLSTLSLDNSGGFFDIDGTIIPW
ncbi:MAG: SDR family oxidoreductase [Gammaproteobacteria bacterium]|nr:SDR family oxidoreductase [Gammaproteobacteria bacterium]